MLTFLFEWLVPDTFGMIVVCRPNLIKIAHQLLAHVVCLAASFYKSTYCSWVLVVQVLARSTIRMTPQANTIE